MAYPQQMSRCDRAWRRERIVAAYRDGNCPTTLAERFALSREHVRRVLRDSGIARRRLDGW